MAVITASMVAALRAKTDAPMMDCKRALTEAAGDAEQAEKLLRAKLGTKASKAADRITAEGILAGYVQGNIGVLVELNCETDFVAKNESFIAFSDAIARLIAARNPADVAALLALEIDHEGERSTVDVARLSLVGRIGENLTIRRFVRYETANKLACYLHGTRMGTLLEYTGENEQLGKDIAMHITAMKPEAVSADEVPAALIEKERAVAVHKAAESGKPEAIVAKMVQGSIDKYLKEVSLLNQTFVKDDKQTVAQVLKAANSSVQRFTLYVVGAGLERRQENFADEVAAQVALAQQ